MYKHPIIGCLLIWIKMSCKNNVQVKIDNLIEDRIKILRKLPEFNLQSAKFKEFTVSVLEELKKDMDKIFASK